MIKRNILIILTGWLRSVDYCLLLITVFMLFLSVIFVSSSSPIIESRLSLAHNYFLYRQIIYVLISIIFMIIFSFLNHDLIYKSSFIGIILCIVFLVILLLSGAEVKGAKRWLYIFGISIQPSEFTKPFFSVVNAFILASSFYYKYYASFILYIIILLLFLLQPDFSMSIILSTIWVGQLFVSGISYLWLIAISSIFLVGAMALCYFIPYIRQRFYIFFDPNNYDNFQISKSIKAFKIGKLTGTGPGEGNIKLLLPDCHTDFIFAVIAEEFGAIFCMFILLIIGIIIIRIWNFVYSSQNLRNLLAMLGILVQFTMQCFINVGVVLNLLPTTGLALPLLSYGGSSSLSISIALGMILSLGRGSLITKRIKI